MLKIINIIITLIFLLFAYFQLNDPDPWVWVSFYGLITVVGAAAIFKIYNKWVIYLGISLCLIGIAYLFPELINWVKMGTPNIADEMKTTRPYIEFVREFFGLIISLIAFLFFGYQGNNLEQKN